MPTVDERLAALEAKVDAITDLRAIVLDIRAEMHQLRADVNQRFAQIDQRFAQIDAKVDRNFVWATGMMLTGFISVIGALIGVVYR